MNKKVKNLFLASLTALFIGYYYQTTWALEIVLLIQVLYACQNEISIQNKFEETLPDLVRMVTPLKAQLYQLPLFILLSLVLVAAIGGLLAQKEPNFQHTLLTFIALNQLIPIFFNFLYQLFFPRKVYTDDNFIYYYKKEIIKIPWTDIKEIELSNTLITFYEEDYKSVLPFKNTLTEADFIKWNDYLTTGRQDKNYEYINATHYKRLGSEN